jgi:serine protease Do
VYKPGFLILVLLLAFSEPLYARANNFPDFTPLVEQIAPAVVNISATRASDNRQYRGILDELFRNRGQEPDNGYQPPQNSEGSGFIISEDGYILTNRHVVVEADQITVRMNNGREYIAKVIGEDAGTDVALLKIKGENLPVIKTGNSEQLKVGEWVLGFGAPFGFDQTVTAGIVSAKRRTLGREQYVPFIQTDVAINPGNSGGPLINLDGEVIGINSQILSRSGGYIGLSFAIPIELAVHVAEQFKKYDGKVKRGYLGVQYQDVTYSLAQAFKMERVEGALLTQVTKGSAAEKAGLEIEDIILKFDGKKINRAGELPFIVGLLEPGTKVKVDILREGKRKTLKLIVGERPDLAVAAESTTNDNELVSLGMTVENIDDELREIIDGNGVIVRRLQDGPAARAGIRRGDVIISINRKDINSVADFEQVVSNLPRGEEAVLLVIRPPAVRRFFTIEVPE